MPIDRLVPADPALAAALGRRGIQIPSLVYIHGDPGTGKTIVASYIAACARALWVTEDELPSHVMDRFDRMGVDRAAIDIIAKNNDPFSLAVQIAATRPTVVVFDGASSRDYMALVEAADPSARVVVVTGYPLRAHAIHHAATTVIACKVTRGARSIHVTKNLHGPTA